MCSLSMRFRAAALVDGDNARSSCACLVTRPANHVSFVDI